MYIQNHLSTHQLFSKPEGRINKSTLMAVTSEDYSDDFINKQNQILIPVDVQVRGQLSSKKLFNSSANINTDRASNENALIQGFLNQAITSVEQLQDLAEASAQSNTSSSYRQEADYKAQELLEIIDDFYMNAEYDGNKIMQGGERSLATGSEGAEYTMMYGDLDRALLGLDNISLTTEANAQTAETDIATALSLLNGQLDMAESDAENLSNRKSVNNESISGENIQYTYEKTYKYIHTTFQNSLSVISEKMIYAVGVQSSKLKDSSIQKINSELAKLAEAVKKAQEKSEEAQATGTAKSEDTYRDKLSTEESEANADEKFSVNLEESVSANQKNDFTDNMPISSEANDIVRLSAPAQQGEDD